MLLLSGAKDTFLKLSFKFCFKKNLQVINQRCLSQRGNLLISQSAKSGFQAWKLKYGGQTQAHRFVWTHRGHQTLIFQCTGQVLILSCPITLQKAGDTWDEEWEPNGNLKYEF